MEQFVLLPYTTFNSISLGTCVEGRGQWAASRSPLSPPTVVDSIGHQPYHNHFYTLKVLLALYCLFIPWNKYIKLVSN